jgi:RNA methyltransferase, TrmH family
MISKSQIKLITSLVQKKYRKQHRLFLVEGVKVIEELLNSHFELEHIFQTKPIFNKVIDTKKTIISEAELKKLSALSTPNDSLALFKTADEKETQKTGLILALDSIRDPGNLGTIVRLCDWFGITQLICSEETVDVYNPKVVQASMGSIARVNVSYVDLSNYIKETNLPVFGAFMEGENIYKKQLPSEGIIILGNEANGISKTIESLVTQKIAIPRFGTLQQTESLNVATAAAIFLSEFRRNF